MRHFWEYIPMMTCYIKYTDRDKIINFQFVVVLTKTKYTKQALQYKANTKQIIEETKKEKRKEKNKHLRQNRK